ncbi:hypothetical protein vBVpaS1601_32 [Vibrio phage vB_VpaS_1601]|uniref:hypothetical protein n=1 Tax=Vibrio phage SHOU24 TaxID=1414739 RepID=UPI0003ED22A3|nr:hypothetical protein SHOU24_54 [Vibrio phage SHOU24]AHI61251.1 hypothetical protein SHOU24_54 [Vibrio phage SHOU24]WHM52725.1 hypothetical protein vBVpaP1601_32 [Vibrio phage vB_VpaP_1601]
MGGENDSQELAIVRNDLKHLGRNHDKLGQKVDSIDEKIEKIFSYMAAQQILNENAEKERERIFKASTMLPVAILTSVISSGVSYLMTKAPTQNAPTPQSQTYIIPNREQKQFDELRVQTNEGP